MDKQLLQLLTAICEDAAFTLVQNARPYGGLDAWRRLSRRFDPQTPMKSVFALIKLLHRSPVALDALLEAIEQWEEAYRVWCAASKMILPDVVQQVALILMLPSELRSHIELTIDQYDDYPELRSYVERYVTTKVTGTDDMQIGAFSGGGGGGKGGGGGGQRDLSQVHCHWCDKTGHILKDCRSKAAGHPKSQAAIDRAAAEKAQKSKSSPQGSAPQWKPTPSTTMKGAKGGGGKGKGKGKGKGVNALGADGDGQDDGFNDWWQQQQGWTWPEETAAAPEVGGLALNSLGVGLGVVPELLRLGAGGAKWCGRDQYGWYFEATVDSGAAITAGPEALAVKAPLQPSKFEGQAFSTANGESVLPLGVRQLAFQTYSGEFVSLKIEICNVDKFLLSVNDLVEQGHEAVFSLRPRIILSNGRTIKMTRARRLFFLRLYLNNQDLMAVDVDGCGSRMGSNSGPTMIEEDAVGGDQPFRRLVQ